MSGPQSPLTSSNGKDRYEDKQEFDSQQVEFEGLQHHINGLANEVSMMPDPIPAERPVDKTDPYGFRALGVSIRIYPNEELAPPPVCLSVVANGKSEIFGTLGNFSVIIGKAKSRKTFSISIAVAAALKRDLILGRFAGSFAENKQTILYFDTEQGRYHVLKVVKRICQLADQPTPDNLQVYPLRGFTAQQVLGFIEWHVYNTANVGLVIIDGIRDTVSDINDSAEASQRATDLLRWSKDCDIHIITVLHMNKGNDSIRGTLGTELQNKAETVAVVSVDPTSKDISVVSPGENRNKSFEPFAFSVDEQGLPFLIDDVPENPVINGRTKKPTVDTMKADDVQAIVRRAFQNDECLRYAQLRTNVIEASQFIGVELAKSRAEEFIRRVETNGYIIKSKPVSGRYEVYKLKPNNLPPG